MKHNKRCEKAKTPPTKCKCSCGGALHGTTEQYQSHTENENSYKLLRIIYGNRIFFHGYCSTGTFEKTLLCVAAGQLAEEFDGKQTDQTEKKSTKD
jgi:hypothetical protein